MKHLFLVVAACWATAPFLFAQETAANGIYFGAISGIQFNRFNQQFAAEIDPKIYSFSIGAGSAWTRNNYVVGFEFLYSSGNKGNGDGSIQYIGFSNTLSFGYNLAVGRTWVIEPTIGVSLDDNQLIVQNKTNNVFQNLTNNQLSGIIGLNVKIVGANGLFNGLKIGYRRPFGGESQWKNTVDGAGSGLNDSVSSFYVQINLGGFLKLGGN
ncbi:MAG: hypothetical protein SNJ55_05795 [Chloroherpetonaceae bacterium]